MRGVIATTLLCKKELKLLLELEGLLVLEALVKCFSK